MPAKKHGPRQCARWRDLVVTLRTIEAYLLGLASGYILAALAVAWLG